MRKFFAWDAIDIVLRYVRKVADMPDSSVVITLSMLLSMEIYIDEHVSKLRSFIEEIVFEASTGVHLLLIYSHLYTSNN